MTTHGEAERVKVDIFSMTKEEAAQFVKDKAYFMMVLRKLMYEYCPIVKVERFEPTEGESISAYLTKSMEQDQTPVLSVVLDPFEVSAMKVAEERGKLKEYVFAASEMTEVLLQVLKEKFCESKTEK
ncbi:MULTISPECIES: hypothetical protein [unclassified Veillonella]|uniref:hypothetical protein n=1 Tax=unclassified Veillonella TaxID=2630086 RepID=UPI000F8D60C4|nr:MULTISPECIES: hypothetical protein [unclassified Veillonella]